MKLSFAGRISDKLAPSVGEALGFSDSFDTSLLDVAREFAFSSETAEEFATWYLRSECLSKFDDGDPALREVRKLAAFDAFRKAEDVCQKSNERIVGWTYDSNITPSLWRRAAALCHEILGKLDINELPGSCAFGPGATAEFPRKRASYHNKWELSSHITARALPYYHAFTRWSSIQLPSKLLVTDENRVTTVPKSFKTDRTIAIEPAWNGFFQKGLGRIIRRRLRRTGLLHPDAQEQHQGLACLASVTGTLATIDLSMASDTVSLALCEALLPAEWFRLVLDLRSPRGRFGEEVVDYAKVSSMGNGFTFELETLLFYCLTVAACGRSNRRRISVYGDDIICPAEKAEEVVSLLAEAGFSVNEKKSFWEGPFRESCGGHFWKGADVSPFYLRQHVTTYGRAITLHNNVMGWLHQNNRCQADEWETVLRLCRKGVSRNFWVPWGVDGGIWADWDETRPVWVKSTQSYRLKVIKTIRWQSYVGSSWGAILHKLWEEDPEAEASWAEKPGSGMEVISATSVYGGLWSNTPVRLA